MKNIFFILLAFLSLMLISISANAENPSDSERRAQEIFNKLRCVVCEGQSLAESQASTAQAMRSLVREQISNGKSNKQIISFFQRRYGDSVLMEPPFKPETFILWLGPFLIIIAGLILFLRYTITHSKKG